MGKARQMPIRERSHISCMLLLKLSRVHMQQTKPSKSMELFPPAKRAEAKTLRNFEKHKDRNTEQNYRPIFPGARHMNNAEAWVSVPISNSC